VLCFLLLLPLVLSQVCPNDEASLQNLYEASESVIYGTVSQSSGELVVHDVIKTSSSTTREFTQFLLSYKGKRPLHGGSVAVFFGGVSSSESLLTVNCAAFVSDCALNSLRSNSWGKCIPTENYCMTARGRIEHGQTFEDYSKNEECTCMHGTVLCEKGLCTCKTDGGVIHHPGDIWKVDACKECLCSDHGGVCSYTCEEDVCLSFILPIVSTILIIAIVIGFVVRRTRSIEDTFEADLDDMLPREQPQVPQQLQTGAHSFIQSD